MSNSWPMAKVNSTDGHVQAGDFVIIPGDKRSGSWDIDDSSVSDTWEEADMSAFVTPGTTALLMHMSAYTTSTQDRTILLTRGHGETGGTTPSFHTLKVYAELGGSSLLIGTTVIVYAPGGIFDYRRFSSAFTIDEFRASLWGYWTK